MSEIVSFAEIKEKYDSEWILLEDPEMGDEFIIEGGKILWHSKNRDEVYRKARELKPKHSAVIYTGKTPRDMVIVL